MLIYKINNVDLEFNDIIYVDMKNGNDSNDGRTDSFATIAKATSSLTTDKTAIILKPGIYDLSSTFLTSLIKFSQNDISYIGEYNSDDRVTINIDNCGFNEGGVNLLLRNFYNINFIRTSASGDSRFLLFYSTAGSKFDMHYYNCSFTGYTSSMNIMCTRNNSSSSGTITFEQCSFKDCLQPNNTGVTVPLVNCISSQAWTGYSLFISNFDENFKPLTSGWENAGDGLNSDGTQAHLGIYGGELSPFVEAYEISYTNEFISSRFSDTMVGYSTPPMETYELKNTGKQWITNIKISLEKNTEFDLFSSGISNFDNLTIFPDEEIHITITPKIGLSVGIHTDTLIINNDNIDINENILFNVIPAPPKNYTPSNIPFNKLLQAGDSFDQQNFVGASYIILGPGRYKMECWGSKGGPNLTGGNGAYTSGIIELNKRQDFSLFTGDSISNFNASTGSATNPNSLGALFGGGAADIRRGYFTTWYDRIALANRIMTAGGGGARGYSLTQVTSYRSYWSSTLGYYWSSTGTTNSYSLQGTGGYANVEGSAGSAVNSAAGGAGGLKNQNGTGGTQPTYWYHTGVNGGNGGGGYYNGNNGGTYSTSSTSSAAPTAEGQTKTHYYWYYYAAGGGGSSYISGHLGCDSIFPNYANNVANKPTHSGQEIHYSGLRFTNTSIVGNTNTGNARILITCLERYPDEEDYGGYIQYINPVKTRRLLEVIKSPFNIMKILGRKDTEFELLLQNFIYMNYKEYKATLNEYPSVIWKLNHQRKYQPNNLPKVFNFINLNRMYRSQHTFTKSIFYLQPILLGLLIKRFQGKMNVFTKINRKLVERKGKFNFYTYILISYPRIKTKILTFLKLGDRSPTIVHGKPLPMTWIFGIKVLRGMILSFKGIQDLLRIWFKITPPRQFPLEVEWNRKPSVDNPWGGRVLNGVIISDKVSQPLDSNVPRSQPLSFAWTKQK